MDINRECVGGISCRGKLVVIYLSPKKRPPYKMEVF
ncbi:hypothetical protein BCE_A0039 (plasmid) [Bacillus cereus ATCC 10987]|uniref:Uncharacterized protein n=1 Tax=Bacillus cereus (strain ATCC 10987 / NRS 248) TaxID=222523 RepID=Q74P55_BACC1|nr:hypothetical protein BCE_A0039 [Bacillus cereus ATCC 10987]